MPILAVAPHWGAWIEIIDNLTASNVYMSHPTGVRGLKWYGSGYVVCYYGRTPLGCVD